MNRPSLPQRLAVALLLELTSGHYRAGQRFFSRREIMRLRKVSSPTATQSLALLTAWGILRAKDRSGHRIRPGFLQKALLRVNQSRLTPLPSQPRWDQKARALLHKKGSFRRMIVISVSDRLNPNAAKFYEDIPNAPIAFPIRHAAVDIFAAAREAGVLVYFFFDDGRPETQKIIAREMRQLSVQGAIILRRLMASSVRALAEPMIKARVPVVTAFNDCENLRMVAVNFNNVGMGHTAAQRLIAAGHRRIVVLLPNEEEEPYYYRDRYHGCLLAAKEQREDRVEMIPLSISIYRTKPLHKAVALFSAGNPARPTAIFATTVNVLTALRPTLEAAGVWSPRKISIIMCSSIPEFPPENEKMDIMRLDFYKIGRESFHALRALHRGEPVEKTLLLDPEYEAHGSVFPPSAG